MSGERSAQKPATPTSSEEKSSGFQLKRLQRGSCRFTTEGINSNLKDWIWLADAKRPTESGEVLTREVLLILRVTVDDSRVYLMHLMLSDRQKLDLLFSYLRPWSCCHGDCLYPPVQLAGWREKGRSVQPHVPKHPWGYYGDRGCGLRLSDVAAPGTRDTHKHNHPHTGEWVVVNIWHLSCSCRLVKFIVISSWCLLVAATSLLPCEGFLQMFFRHISDTVHSFATDWKQVYTCRVLLTRCSRSSLICMFFLFFKLHRQKNFFLYLKLQIQWHPLFSNV